MITGRDGQVTTKSRDQLHYVDAVLHEVMRIRPVAPITIKKTTAATKLGMSRSLFISYIHTNH